jgi:hypothetical protein
MENKFEKDNISKAILNNDKSSYDEYKARRQDKQEVCKLQQKMDCLGNEMKELKDLIYKIVKGK